MGAAAGKERDSNFELLRIVCILFIVTHHIIVHGDWNWAVISQNEGLHAFMVFINLFGKVGVNVFVLITGYFLIRSKGIKLEKAVRLWLEILFYSVVISAVFGIVKSVDYSTADVYRILTPVLSETWWFASCYMVLIIVSPFLNSALERIGRRRHLIVMLAMVFVMSALPIFTGLQIGCAEYVWFVVLYMIGAYIGSGEERVFSLPVRSYLLMTLAAMALLIVFSVLYVTDCDNSLFKDLMSNQALVVVVNIVPVMWDNNLLMLFASLAMFLMFRNVRMGYNKYVNVIATTVFGIYLISDSNEVRSVLYSEIIGCHNHTGALECIVVIVLGVIGIFLVCMALEYIRGRMFDLIESRIGANQFFISLPL